MNRYIRLDDLPEFNEASLTIGNFDGLHLGHRKIIYSLLAVNLNQPAIAVTFQKVPIEYLNPGHFKGYLFPSDQKEKYLEKLGVSHIVSLDFPEVRNVDSIDFIKVLLSKINKLHLVIGYNFQFGKGNAGNVNFLRNISKKLNFELTVVDPVSIDHTTISSSLIRDMIQNGRMEEASHMLGRPYFINSDELRGDGIGRTIGFPTINLKINKQVTPQTGVYYTLYPYQDRLYPAMTYIGNRPTVNGHELRNETNIINFEEHSENISRIKNHTIYFIRKIRGEKKLHNLEELRKTIYNDREVILGLYHDHGIPDLLEKIIL